VVLEAAIAAIERRSGNQVGVRLRTPASEREVDGSDLLVAVGRTPNTRGIGLESAGVELDLRGYVKVNERLETTAPGVWAMGECAGSPQFTPVVSGWCAISSTERRRLVLGVRTQPHLAIIEQERRLFAQPKCPQRSKTTLAETVERSSGWTFWSRLRPIGVGHKSEQ
jgi:thioredoxin reductase